MINSSNHSSPLGRTPHSAGPENSNRPAPAKGSSSAGGSDRVSLESATQVRAQLESLPVIRPEVVEAAQKLVVSPNYPSLEIIERIAATLLTSPDLTEVSDIS